MQTSNYNKLIPTSKLQHPTQYVEMLLGQFSPWAFDQEKAMEIRGKWHEVGFGTSLSAPLDLEIGTGNGFFFAHYAKVNPDRNILGLEITYKTLIQTIKRAINQGSRNVRVARFHASQIDSLLAPGEINNVFIYFPDPWPKKRHAKNRLIQPEFLDKIFDIQKPHSFLEFKTDSADYFAEALDKMKNSKYKVSRLTWDLHQSEWANENFMTHFEKLWTGKGLKTHLVRLEKP